MNRRHATAEQLGWPGRGVYLANFRVRGEEAMIAVDSSGSIRKLKVLSPGVDRAQAWESLWAWLDAHDPVPQLRLVTAPPTPPPAPAERPPEDQLTYALRRARQHAYRFRRLT